MPFRQPFTSLCQQLARGPKAGRADLHTHTTASDGTYTPAQLVDLARRCGLAALAITDHDTLAGLEPARYAADGKIEIIAGCEITCAFRGKELHLLAYFFDPADTSLNDALADIRKHRIGRFATMVERLRECGVSIDESAITEKPDAWGRRHLAQILVDQGHAGSIREAFGRWLCDGGRADVPKKRLPVADAIALVRGAGGVAAWAHPAYDGNDDHLSELARLGLQAVEVDFPQARRARGADLRKWAQTLGLAVTAGSDCHGPGRRGVGACTVSDDELTRLRRLARG